MSGCSGAVVTVAAGRELGRPRAPGPSSEEWGGGIECLAGIPGLVGATPIQNVGAYGVEVAQLIASVRTWDRVADRQVTFAAADCGFGFRTSRFKTDPNRYLILDVTFQLPLGSLSAPIRYAELARTLAVEVGERVPAADARAAVLELRAREGHGVRRGRPRHLECRILLHQPDPRTPIGPPRCRPRRPATRTDDGRVKTSAAWLIEQAGFGKGYGTPPATLSTKHALALTNRGGARPEDLLASRPRDPGRGPATGSASRLVPEPTFWGARCDVRDERPHATPARWVVVWRRSRSGRRCASGSSWTRPAPAAEGTPGPIAADGDRDDDGWWHPDGPVPDLAGPRTVDYGFVLRRLRRRAAPGSRARAGSRPACTAGPAPTTPTRSPGPTTPGRAGSWPAG